MITFDDGARNNLLYAGPILRKRCIRAFFFVVDEMVGTQDLLWVDKVFLWTAKVVPGEYNIGPLHLVIATGDDRISARSELMAAIRDDFSKKNEILIELDRSWPKDQVEEAISRNPSRYACMDCFELQALREEGHFIGYHSAGHDILSCLSADELGQQLQILPDGEPYNTRAFALPFGKMADYDDRVANKLFEYGFRPILANHEAPTTSNVVGRINLPNTDDPYVTHAYLSGLHFFFRSWSLFPVAESNAGQSTVAGHLHQNRISEVNSPRAERCGYGRQLEGSESDGLFRIKSSRS